MNKLLQFKEEKQILKWANTTKSTKVENVIQVQNNGDKLFYYFVNCSGIWANSMTSIDGFWFQSDPVSEQFSYLSINSFWWAVME